MLSVDKKKLEKIDKKNPHPLLLQDIMAGSALFHATILPLKNVKTSLGSNYDAIRHIIYDSMRVDEDGQYFQTLKWLSYKKWENTQNCSPKFDCPHCSNEIPGLAYDASKGECPHCHKEVLLTDMIGLLKIYLPRIYPRPARRSHWAGLFLYISSFADIAGHGKVNLQGNMWGVFYEIFKVQIWRIGRKPNITA